VAIDRRDFLKLAALATGGFFVPKAMAEPGHGVQADYEDSFGVLVDTTDCIACRKCELACNQANDLPRRDRAFFEDTSVLKTHRRPNAEAFTVINQVKSADGNTINAKIQCMHCLTPACASACIVGALKKTPSGPVVYDAAKCIGCRYCMVACPFQIPTYEYANALTPRVRKCGFCAERIAKAGEAPACVKECPNESLTFANRRALLETAHRKINSAPDRYLPHIYGEHEVGGTSWLYLAAADFAPIDLPSLPDEAPSKLTEKIQHSVFKGFIPPIALYGLLGLLALSQRGDKKDEPADGGHHE
jgi:Fe-S-cluster-containing dehydrogenase component